jgi:hypothetical protein
MSKFNAILNAAKDRAPEAKELDTTKDDLYTPIPETTVSPKAMGRPKGKRSNPDYEQVTAYIKKETHKNVKRELLDNEDIHDFSELLEILLVEWLSTQKSKSLF